MSCSYGRIVLFGASTVQYSFSEGGWGARLSDHFQRRADIVNRGFAGYNSRWGRLILPRLLPNDPASVPPDAVVILFGSNDASRSHMSPLHVPLPEYKSNLAQMRKYLVDKVGVTKESVILVTPAVLDEDMCREYMKTCFGLPLDRFNSDVKRYAEAVKQVGQELSVPTVDLFSLLSSHDEPKQFLSDGLHLSARGSKVLADSLVPLLEERLCSKQPVFPDWDNVDHLHPEKTFDIH